MATKFLGGIDVSGDFLSTTPPISDNSTKVATTAFVKGQGYLNSLPTHTHAWTDITGKPSTFTPSAHTHSISDVTGLQTALDGKQPAGSYLTSIPAEYLTNEEADSLYQVRGSYASESHTHTFSSITSKPTTLSGYGITDAATSAQGTKADTAHGWGNHALAGYLTSGSLSGYATQSYVNDAVASVVNSAPERLDTLRELAQALGDDPNFATTITDLIAGKANSSHTHTIAQVTGLQTALDGKQAAGSYAASSHTHDIASITDAQRWWNNFGDHHSFRTSFDAEGGTLSTGFGWRYVQGAVNGPGVGDTGNGQYYALSVGLGNDYSSTDYAMQLAIPRLGSNPYISIRFQEGGRLGGWTKISAAYADSAGSVAWGDVSGKPSTFTPSSHTHTIANVTGLQTALDGKQAAGSYAAASHGHTIANITGLQDALNDKQPRGEYLTSLGFSYSTGVNGGHVVQRDGNGYIYANHINFSTGETENPSINSFFVSNGDGWSRKASVAHVKSQLGLGSAAYASTGSFVASNGSSWTPHPESSRSGSWNTFYTDYGYIQFGPANSSWAHIYSDKNFYFNQNIYVNDAKLATESYVTSRGYITSVPAQSWSSITGKPAGWLDATCLVQGHEPSGRAQPSGFYESYLGAGNPTGTWFNYVNVRHSNPDNGHGFQAGMSYYDNNFWFRSYQGALNPTFQEWAYAISSQNIGEQSVNYANSAGSVAWGNVTGRPSSLSEFTNNLTSFGNRIEFQHSADRYSQAWRNGSTGAYWWVTTDADKLGLHRNGDGDKFYFSNGGDFYSTTNGWLSTALSNKLSTGGTATNSSQLEGFSAYALVSEARGVHSGSDFPNGTLVRTDIDANGWAGDSFVMEVSGKSYSGSDSPFKLVMQGYLYADTIINVSAMSYGSYFPGGLMAFRLDGKLCFWWARGSYWNSFEVHVRSANGDSWNRVTSIDDSRDPGGDKRVGCTPIQVIHSNNIGSQSVNYASSAGSVAWGNVTGKPSTFTPSSHTHAISDVSGLQTALNGKASTSHEHTWTSILSRPTRLSEFTNDLGNYGGWITSDGRAYPRRSDGRDMNFYWDGQGGQPTWLWGSNDGQNMYVWNPSNFSVNYATSAGNADTLDGYHASVAGSANTIPTRNGSGYLIPENWIQLNGTYGLYSPTNNAHWRPNPNSYGPWLVTGTRNGWSGIEFDASNGQVNLMINPNSNTSGFHNNSYGWQMRWEGGTIYCNKNNYGGGTQAVVLDSSNWTSYVSIPSQLVTGNTSSASLNSSAFNIYNSNFTEDRVELRLNADPVLIHDRMNGTMSFRAEAVSTYEMQLTPEDIRFQSTRGGWAPIVCEYVNQVSDINLKHEIQTISLALEKVNQLRGVEFLWKSNNKPSIGFIAQEVEEVVPVAVGNHNGTKTIDYSKIIPILTQAIKEQQDQINILMQEIQLLKTK